MVSSRDALTSCLVLNGRRLVTWHLAIVVPFIGKELFFKNFVSMVRNNLFSKIPAIINREVRMEEAPSKENTLTLFALEEILGAVQTMVTNRVDVASCFVRSSWHCTEKMGHWWQGLWTFASLHLSQSEGLGRRVPLRSSLTATSWSLVAWLRSSECLQSLALPDF